MFCYRQRQQVENGAEDTTLISCSGRGRGHMTNTSVRVCVCVNGRQLTYLPVSPMGCVHVSSSCLPHKSNIICQSAVISQNIGRFSTQRGRGLSFPPAKYHISCVWAINSHRHANSTKESLAQGLALIKAPEKAGRRTKQANQSGPKGA